MGLYLKQLELGPMGNFVYLVGDTVVKRCWIVDPAWNVATAVEAAKADGYVIAGALITHSHFDHCNALQDLMKTGEVPVYVRNEDAEIAAAESSSGLFGDLRDFHRPPVSPGETISLGETRLTFLHTPGHTPGSQCFLVGDRLLAGDTLFLTACGRCDLPGGNPAQLHDSLHRVLARLPEETVLYPGHNYSPTQKNAPLGTVKNDNPFLQATSLDRFLDLVGTPS